MEPTQKEAAISNDADSRYVALRNHSIRFEDAIDPNAERVDELRKIDIVFGRGKGFQNHPGNKRMRDIVEKYKTQYHSLRRAEKRKLVESVYKEITEGGARFLKKVEGENAWVIVDAPVAIQKVSLTLRRRKPTDTSVTEDTWSVDQGISTLSLAPVDPESTSYLRRASMQTLTNNSASMFDNVPLSGPFQAPSPSKEPNETASFRASRMPFGLDVSQLAKLHGARLASERFDSVRASLAASRMVTGLDTSQLAVLHGAGFGGIRTLSLPIPTNMQHQLIREQMLLQQLEDAVVRSYTIPGARSRIPQAIPFVGRLRSNADLQQSRGTRRSD
eukprot:scaffold4642_cov112-Cylindrotheca_fusiformis.AAC.9